MKTIKTLLFEHGQVNKKKEERRKKTLTAAFTGSTDSMIVLH